METSRKRNWQSEQKPHLMLCRFTPCSHRNCQVAPAAEQSSTSIILNLMAEKGSMRWCTPKDSVPAYSCLGQGKTSSYGSFPVTSSWEQNKSTAEGGFLQPLEVMRLCALKNLPRPPLWEEVVAKGIAWY